MVALWWLLTNNPATGEGGAMGLEDYQEIKTLILDKEDDRCCQTNANQFQLAAKRRTYAEQSWKTKESGGTVV
jgi:hypothetical protein